MTDPTPSQQAASAAASPKATPLERVARAIAHDLGQQDSGRSGFVLPADLTLPYLDQGKVDFAQLAKAALQALRQVDDETVGAMADDCGFGWPWDYEAEHSEILPTLKAAFIAAIDHILSQSPNQGSER